MTSGWRRRKRHAEKNHVAYSLRFALCALPVRRGATVEENPSDRCLGGASASALLTSVESLRQGLRELGYVEGKNIVIEYRYAEGKRERWPVLAQEIALLKPDVIVMSGTGFIRTVKQVTSTIPIVVATAGDLVETGVVETAGRKCHRFD